MELLYGSRVCINSSLEMSWWLCCVYKMYCRSTKAASYTVQCTINTFQRSIFYRVTCWEAFFFCARVVHLIVCLVTKARKTLQIYTTSRMCDIHTFSEFLSPCLSFSVSASIAARSLSCCWSIEKSRKYAATSERHVFAYLLTQFE